MSKQKLERNVPDEVVREVFKTTDYGKFKTIKGNRIVRHQNLTRVRKSMEVKQLLIPIIVNEHFEIIDGQNRFEASFSLGLPIYYLINKGYGLPEVQRANVNMQKWDNRDYLHSFCEQGEPEYVKMKEFMDTYPHFSLTSVQILLTGLTKTRQQQVNEKGQRWYHSDFKNGKLKIVDITKSIEIANSLMELKDHIDHYKDGPFVNTICVLFEEPKFDIKRLVRLIKLNPTKIDKSSTVRDYRYKIERLYNKGISPNNQIQPYNN